MKRSQTRKKMILKALLIFELVVCYMALLTVVSGLRGPQRYEVLSDAPLLNGSDFISFDGAPPGQALTLSNETPGTAVGYGARLSLAGLERIHISFQLDCPAQYSGGTLFIDLYDHERGYDSEEQEHRLTLQEGLNEVSVYLEPGEEAPEEAQVRIFTLDAAGYTVDLLQICREVPLPKVTPMMAGVLVGCLILCGLILVLFRRACVAERNAAGQSAGRADVLRMELADASTDTLPIIQQQKTVRLDHLGTAQELFLELENTIKEYDVIRIKGNGRKDIALCIDAFVKKYQQIIDSANVEAIIKLKFKEVDTTRKYLELQDDYDTDYYLNDCGGYLEFTATSGQLLEPRLAELLLLIDATADDVILDIGCGRGELTHTLAQTAKKVIGIDYSAAAVQIATETFGATKEVACGRLQYIHGDILHLDIEQKFNKIIMADVYEHIEAAEMEQLLQKAADLLTEDGRLFIHTAPNLDYYDKVYPQLVKEAEKKGEFLPLNPRSRYEDKMHINEQSTASLKHTLLKYFSDALVWTGAIQSEEHLLYLDKQNISNDITAIAGKGLQAQNIFKQLYYERLEKTNVKAELNSPLSAVEVKTNNILTIPIVIRNNGEKPFRSQKPYPVYLSYHIFDENQDVVVFDGSRSVLNAPVLPNTAKEEILLVSTKDVVKGMYRLVVDLVQEEVFWFGDIDSQIPLEIELHVI